MYDYIHGKRELMYNGSKECKTLKLNNTNILNKR